MKKPNIAVLLNAFWIHGQGMSGGEQMAIQIFSRIRSFSAVHWFTSFDGKAAAQPIIKHVKFSVTPNSFDRLPIGISYILRTLLVIVRLFGKHVDIIYSGSDFFPDVVPAWLYTRFHPNTFWVQCVFHIYPDWRTRPGNKIVNFIALHLQKGSLLLAKKADKLININKEVCQALIKQNFDATRITIITPGINLNLIESIAPEVLPQNHFDAIFLGRLNPSKGIYDLPKIWKQVLSTYPRARLAIIGGGSENIRAELQYKLSFIGIENQVELLGFLESEKIYSMFKCAKVFIFPSYEEGFGIAIVEALGCGLPVVAWDLPVYESLFGEAVTTVPLGDCSLFAKAIIQKLKNKPVAYFAKQCVSQYTWDKSSLDMEKCLHNLKK